MAALAEYRCLQHEFLKNTQLRLHGCITRPSKRNSYLEVRYQHVFGLKDGQHDNNSTESIYPKPPALQQDARLMAALAECSHDGASPFEGCELLAGMAMLH